MKKLLLFLLILITSFSCAKENEAKEQIQLQEISLEERNVNWLRLSKIKGREGNLVFLLKAHSYFIQINLY